MFFFQHFKDIILCFPCFLMRSQPSFLALFPCMSCVLSPLIAFMIFSLSFVFSVFSMSCLFMVFFVWTLLGVLWSWYCGLISFIILGKFLAIVSTFVLFFLSSSSEIPIIFMLNCLLLFHQSSCALLWFSLFSLCFSLSFCWPVCPQVHRFFPLLSVDKPIKIIFYL